MKELLARSVFYLENMGKVGRPKKKITHFIDLVFCCFLISVLVLILIPTPLTLMVVGLLWGIGEVASAFK
jgi:tetrahydromethanopterin S-methyltransferase subunit E